MDEELKEIGKALVLFVATICVAVFIISSVAFYLQTLSSVF